MVSCSCACTFDWQAACIPPRPRLSRRREVGAGERLANPVRSGRKQPYRVPLGSLSSLSPSFPFPRKSLASAAQLSEGRPMTIPPRILCLGAMLWDVIGHSATRIEPGDDLPGRITRQPGGVALNVALALARQGLAPAMLAAIGRDAPGDALIVEAQGRGVDTRWLYRDDGFETDSYIAIESPDGLVAAIADARALETAGGAILAPLRDGRLGDVARPWQGTLVIDGNLTAEILAGIADDRCLAGADLRIVP